MKNIIYADNAATTKPDPDAFEAMKPWLLEEFGNVSQPYSFARKPRKAIAEARATIAACINALPEEIYFTSGGTESDNWAIKGSAFSDPAHRATITSSFEHHAVLRSCAAIEKLGYPVTYLCPTTEGLITSENLKSVITNSTRLVSIMYANNEIGSIQPIKELCAIAHSHGAIFHTDAVQAVGHVQIDVRDLGVDMLSASAHKFNGPKGIGFLFVRKGTLLNPYADGGAQEHGHRAGTENVAAIMGMAAALKKGCADILDVQNRSQEMVALICSMLDSCGIDYIRNGNADGLKGILSLSFREKDGEALLHRLDLKGIMVSTGSACDSQSTRVSHVLKAIKAPDEYAKGTIRLSFGKYNTIEEARTIGETLISVLKEKA